MKIIPIIGFLILVALIGCKTEANKIKDNDLQDECIREILLKDTSLGSKRNHECVEMSLSITIDRYVEALSELDFSKCPKSFSEAFRKHIKAWEDMKEITDNFPDIRGEMHELFDHIETTRDSILFKELLSAVWSSWDVVEKESGVY